MIKPNVSYSDLERLSNDGPDLIMRGLGRVFGLGPAERRALAGKTNTPGVPGWAWATLAFGAGFVAAARIERRWPDRIPELVAGRRQR